MNDEKLTATDELRRMLDERGVEWHGDIATYWRDADAVESLFADNALDVSLYAVSPEQAIEATLGRGTCHPVANDNLNESEGTGDAWANCSECGYLLCVLTDPSSPMPNYCPSCGRKVVDDASVG